MCARRGEPRGGANGGVAIPFAKVSSRAMARVASVGEVSEGKLKKVEHDGKTLLLTKVGDEYYAIENRCSHLGLSLAMGELRDGTITCPFHGSRFDVRTGENLDWVNGVAGIKTPAWTHKLIALGRRPAPIRTHRLTLDGDGLSLG